MKIELDIPIEEFDYYDNYGVDGNNVKSFMDIVIDRVAEKMLIEVCGLYKTDIHEALSDRMNYFKQTIENRITEELSKNCYVAIRDRVAEKVVKDTAEKYERSRQYRDVKKQLEIESDSAINTGMRALISDIVKNEVKKIIKL